MTHRQFAALVVATVIVNLAGFALVVWLVTS